MPDRPPVRAAGVGVVLVAAAVVAGFVLGRGPDRPAPTPARPAQPPVAVAYPVRDAEWLEVCRGQGRTAALDAVTPLFESGTPLIVTRTVVGRSTHLVLFAADRSHWGECEVRRLPGAALVATLTTYRADTVSTWVTVRATPACNEGYRYRDRDGRTACRRFRLHYADRLPPAVAAVRLTAADGVQTGVGAQQGFLLYDRVLRLPRGRPVSGADWVTRIDYLDSVGRTIAARRISAGAFRRAAALPDLERYPSLRSHVGVTSTWRLPLADRPEPPA